MIAKPASLGVGRFRVGYRHTLAFRRPRIQEIGARAVELYLCVWDWFRVPTQHDPTNDQAMGESDRVFCRDIFDHIAAGLGPANEPLQ